MDEKGSSNNELFTVRGMSRRVDVPDVVGQQILPDCTIGSSASSVQPGNIPSSDHGLDANSQWRKWETVGKFVLSDSADVRSQ